MIRNCLKVAIYFIAAKSSNILKSGFLQKKYSTDFIFKFLNPKLQKLFAHIRLDKMTFKGRRPKNTKNGRLPQNIKSEISQQPVVISSLNF